MVIGLVLAALGVLGIIAYRMLIRWCSHTECIDWGGVWINRVDCLIRWVCRHVHGLQGQMIPLPAQGAALVVSNHISGLDPFLLVAAARRPLRFLIAREEYERFGLKWLFKAAGCIPVERGGGPEFAFREALRALAAGEVIALFPHGRIHVPEQTEQVPPRLKGGVIKLAQRSGTQIYPVFISGVRAPGYVLPSLILPSRVSLTLHAPMACDKQSYDACLSDIARILHGTGL